jgi:hypothetical protein
MSIGLGPSIHKTGLILNLDSANLRSYRGEPTSNLLVGNRDNLQGGNFAGYCGNTTNVTFNTTETKDPFGRNRASKIVRDSSAVCSGLYPAWGMYYDPGAGNTVISGTTYTVSIYLKGAVGGEAITVGLNDAHVTGYALTTEWKRYTLTATASASNPRGFQFVINSLNCTVYFYGAQLEQKSYATHFCDGTRGNTNDLGGGWTDLSGFSNHAISNGPTFESTNGGVLNFDGVDDHLSIPYTASLAPTAAMSAETWVYSANWSVLSTQGRIISKTEGGGYHISLNEGVIIPDGSIGAAVYYAGVGYKATHVLRSTLSAGWHQIGYTFDGQVLTMYVDGVAVGTPATHTSNVGAAYAVTNGFQIGAEATGTDSGAGGVFVCKMSVIRMYNTCLTATQFKQNFLALRSRFGI